jgi:hypothetical protein
MAQVLREKKCWWEAKDGDELAKIASEAFRHIDGEQDHRRKEHKRWLRLYENKSIAGLDGSNYTGQSKDQTMQINVVQSIIDTLTAKISTNRTRPVFYTEAGKYEMQQRGKGLTKFFDGTFHNLKIYRENREIFHDGAVFGTGYLKKFIQHYPKGKSKILVERVFPDEVVVCDVDGRYAKPRSMFQYKEVSKHLLARRYPRYKQRIEESEKMRSYSEKHSDLIDMPTSVVEAWHLPSYPGAGDGLHAIFLSNCCPEREVWHLDKFSILPWRWKKRKLGFYGVGVCEELYPIQREIDFVCEKIQEYANLGSTAVLTGPTAKINAEHLLSNVALRHIEAQDPNAIKLFNMGAIPQELFVYLGQLIDRAYHISGVTQLSAMGLKPAGLDSAPAQREFKDTESQRFLDVGQSWDDYHLDITDLGIDLNKELAEQDPSHSVMVKGDYGLEDIKWKDVDMERDQFMLQILPTSYLPRTPGARFQAVKEYLEAFPEMRPYAYDLLDFPDLKAVSQEYSAPLNVIKRAVDRMLYGKLKRGQGVEELYEPPGAFTDPALAKQITNGKLDLARLENVPEERLLLVEEYMLALIDLEEKQKLAQIAEAQKMQALAGLAAPQPAAQPGQQAALAPPVGATGPGEIM